MEQLRLDCVHMNTYNVRESSDSQCIGTTRTMKGHTMTQGQRVKHELHMRGSSLKRWAQEQGYPYRTVSDVVRGVNKATFGVGHEVAVALGLKRSKT